MIQYKNSKFDDSIVDAMLVSNAQNGSAEKFTAIDAIIMSIVHEHWLSKGQCIVSNKYLSGRALTTQATIQKSINKLCQLNFIFKKVQCIDGKRCRIMIYNQDTVEAFKLQMNEIAKKEGSNERIQTF